MASEIFPIRTDLAVETQESIRKRESDLRGVEYNEEKIGEEITICRVSIITENAAKQMGRPRGEYVTIEAKDMGREDVDYHRDISEIFGDTLREMLGLSDKKKVSVLIVGLGNREVTPDALGPRVIDNLFITRHIMREFGAYAFGNREMNKISGLVPGVMAQTGMECVEIIRGVVYETKPDYVITVDALAARSTKRLGRTIQLTNTGIVPSIEAIRSFLSNLVSIISFTQATPSVTTAPTIGTAIAIGPVTSSYSIIRNVKVDVIRYPTKK